MSNLTACFNLNDLSTALERYHDLLNHQIESAMGIVRVFGLSGISQHDPLFLFADALLRNITNYFASCEMVQKRITDFSGHDTLFDEITKQELDDGTKNNLIYSLTMVHFLDVRSSGYSERCKWVAVFYLWE